MVDAVNHGVASGTTTTAWETTKGAVKGGIFPIVVGALLLGGLVYGGAALLSGGAVSGVGAWIAGLSIPAKLGIIAAGIGAWVGGGVAAIGAAVGGVVGFFKGTSRVGKESQEYQRAVESRALAGMSKAEYNVNVGRQQVAMAIQEQLNNQRMEQIAAQMGPAQEKSHAEDILKRRAEAAAASQQIGG